MSNAARVAENTSASDTSAELPRSRAPADPDTETWPATSPADGRRPSQRGAEAPSHAPPQAQAGTAVQAGGSGTAVNRTLRRNGVRGNDMRNRSPHATAAPAHRAAPPPPFQRVDRGVLDHRPATRRQVRHQHGHRFSEFRRLLPTALGRHTGMTQDTRSGAAGHPTGEEQGWWAYFVQWLEQDALQGRDNASVSTADLVSRWAQVVRRKTSHIRGAATWHPPPVPGASLYPQPAAVVFQPAVYVVPGPSHGLWHHAQGVVPHRGQLNATSVTHGAPMGTWQWVPSPAGMVVTAGSGHAAGRAVPEYEHTHGRAVGWGGGISAPAMPTATAPWAATGSRSPVWGGHVVRHLSPVSSPWPASAASVSLSPHSASYVPARSPRSTAASQARSVQDMEPLPTAPSSPLPQSSQRRQLDVRSSGLPSPLLRALEAASMTQWRNSDVGTAVKHVMDGGSAAVQAPPAAGKTTALVAAVLGIVQAARAELAATTATDPQTLAVIVVPSRESALQLRDTVIRWSAAAGFDGIDCIAKVSRQFDGYASTGSPSPRASISGGAGCTGQSGDLEPCDADAVGIGTAAPTPAGGMGDSGGASVGCGDADGPHDSPSPSPATCPLAQRPGFGRVATSATETGAGDDAGAASGPATATASAPGALSGTAGADAGTSKGVGAGVGAGAEPGVGPGVGPGPGPGRGTGRGTGRGPGSGAGAAAGARGGTSVGSPDAPYRSPYPTADTAPDAGVTGGAQSPAPVAAKDRPNTAAARLSQLPSAHIIIATPGKLDALPPELLSGVAIVAVDDADGVLGRSTFAAQTAALFHAVATGSDAGGASMGAANPRQAGARSPQLLLVCTTVPAVGRRPLGIDQRQATAALRQLLALQFSLPSALVLCCGHGSVLHDHHSHRRFVCVQCRESSEPWWEAQLSSVLGGLAAMVAKRHGAVVASATPTASPQRGGHQAGAAPRQVMVFTQKNSDAPDVARVASRACPSLRVAHIRSCRISTKEGDARDAAANHATWSRFLAREVDVLVCSDAGAVGMDTVGVWAVVNIGTVTRGNEYMYAHRAGRCGRQSGSTGYVVTLVSAHAAPGKRRSRRERLGRGGVQRGGRATVDVLGDIHASFAAAGRDSRVGTGAELEICASLPVLR